MNRVSCKSAAEAIEAALGDSLDLSHQDRSFSPFYSDIGLGFTDASGINCIYLHYNRTTVTLGSPFLIIDAAPRHERTALRIRQVFESGSADIAFCARNTWIVDIHQAGGINFRLNDPKLSETRLTRTESDCFIFDGYLPPGDTARDPDYWFPVVVGLRAIRGQAALSAGDNDCVKLTQDESGRLTLCFTINVLDIDHRRVVDLLTNAPDSCEKALMLSRRWLNDALGDLYLESEDEREHEVLAKAAYTLAFNACAAPGNLKDRIAAFPSRGSYPTHFLWDACFQNLALEYMEPGLAIDSLLLLTENLREDGKMPHFLCSTWTRPHISQPPLVGWAALRLVKQRNDLDFARQVLPALMKNTQWWLIQRMSRCGLILCPDPLETGWDNTPRMDRGKILPCDMNSYLLLQMRCCRELADMVGDAETAAIAGAQGDEFARKMVDILYDGEHNLFRDVLVETGEHLPTITPACFLPLLADVPVPDDRARNMIERYLLDSSKLFGDVPFPCVAYDEDAYTPDNWWRGPMWPPIAYLMLKVLEKYGYVDQMHTAAQRLYAIMLRDGDLRELFNSQTGEGLGRYQQGWSAAVFLRLKMEYQARSHNGKIIS